MAKRGKEMLLVDLDPQARASKWLERDAAGRAFVETLLDDGDLLPLVCQTPSGIDLIPCGVQFAGFDRDAGGEPGGEFFLRHALERLPADTWDFVLLDCPPSLKLTSVSALVAADVMLVPLEATLMTLEPLPRLFQPADGVIKRLNRALLLAAIVVCQADLRTNHARDLLRARRTQFGATVCDAI